MKRLSKQHIQARDDLIKRFQDAAAEIGPAIAKANEAIAEYNNLIAEVETWRDEVVNDMDNYESERSEKWEESEAAEEFREWKGEYEGIDTSLIDEIDEPDADMAEILESLPEERGGF